MWKYRTRSLNPTLRVATAFNSVEEARYEGGGRGCGIYAGLTACIQGGNEGEGVAREDCRGTIQALLKETGHVRTHAPYQVLL